MFTEQHYGNIIVFLLVLQNEAHYRKVEMRTWENPKRVSHLVLTMLKPIYNANTMRDLFKNVNVDDLLCLTKEVDSILQNMRI